MDLAGEWPIAVEIGFVKGSGRQAACMSGP